MHPIVSCNLHSHGYYLKSHSDSTNPTLSSDSLNVKDVRRIRSICCAAWHKHCDSACGRRSQWGDGFMESSGPMGVPINGWLVVWNMFYFPIYWVANHPNWLSYFSEGWPNHQPVLLWVIPPFPMMHQWDHTSKSGGPLRLWPNPFAEGFKETPLAVPLVFCWKIMFIRGKGRIFVWRKDWRYEQELLNLPILRVYLWFHGSMHKRSWKTQITARAGKVRVLVWGPWIPHVFWQC